MLHLSIKTSKKVNNFKKHQRLKDHYNWVWPTLVAPRQALATQWVALVTVCWKITSGFGANLRKFWIETLFQHQLTHLNSIQVEAVGKPWILRFSWQKMLQFLVDYSWSSQSAVTYNSSHAGICWIHSSWRWCQSRKSFLRFSMKKKLQNDTSRYGELVLKIKPWWAWANAHQYPLTSSNIAWHQSYSNKRFQKCSNHSWATPTAWPPDRTTVPAWGRAKLPKSPDLGLRWFEKLV